MFQQDRNLETRDFGVGKVKCTTKDITQPERVLMQAELNDMGVIFADIKRC
jgi:hypothetical protein